MPDFVRAIAAPIPAAPPPTMATFVKLLPPRCCPESVKKLRAAQSVDHEPRFALLSTILFPGNVGAASDGSSELVHWPRLATPQSVLDVVAMRAQRYATPVWQARPWPSACAPDVRRKRSRIGNCRCGRRLVDISGIGWFAPVVSQFESGLYHALKAGSSTRTMCPAITV